MTKKVIVVDDNERKRGHIIAAIEAIAKNNDLEIEVVPFTHVEPYLEYLGTQPENVVAVCADNSMYGKDRGVEMLSAAHKALHDDVALFWSSSYAPTEVEQKALLAGGVNYTVATALISGTDVVALMDMLRPQKASGTLSDDYAKYNALFAFEDAIKKEEKKSALDMARREGDARTPLAQATRPSDGTLGVEKK